MKFFILIILFFFISEHHSLGQSGTDSNKPRKISSGSLQTDSAKLRKNLRSRGQVRTGSNKAGKFSSDSLQTDSTKLGENLHSDGGLGTDTNKSGKFRVDSLQTDSTKRDSIQRQENLRAKTYEVILYNLLKQNKFLSLSTPPVSFISTKKLAQGKEYLFYLLSGILLLFGFFKVFYVKYFNNIFRVFFNTSLRQNQLTDLLLQARLPSLIFNIFFTITAGIYAWLILLHYHVIQYYNKIYLLFCIILIGLIYCIKFLVLKFIGWVTGMIDALDTYIFVIFLINKIIGIILIPFIIILAFAASNWLDSMVIFSLLILGIFFLLRFFRSYNLLQHQLDIKRLHFFLYIFSVEIFPLFLIFKALQKLSLFTVE